MLAFSWKGVKRLYCVFLVPDWGIWEQSAVLVIGLVYQQSKTKLRDPVDGKWKTVHLPEHLRCQSQKSGIASFTSNHQVNQSFPKMKSAMRVTIMTATCKRALRALQHPWNSKKKKATAIFMSLQRLGAGCPLHAPHSNIGCVWVGRRGELRRRKSQWLLHTHTVHCSIAVVWNIALSQGCNCIT